MAVLAVVAVCVTVLAGCAGGEPRGAAPGAPSPAPTAQRTAVDRALAIEAATRRWGRATTLPEARAAAEDARNLVTGSRGLGAGDLDGDGRVERVATGLLPEEDGSPGLASPLASGCVERDVLGGSWAQPRARWRELTERIERWRPDANTFPQLPSHAQRVVGWATLATRAGGRDEAIEYSVHAAGHARIVHDALTAPRDAGCPV